MAVDGDLGTSFNRVRRAKPDRHPADHVGIAVGSALLRLLSRKIEASDESGAAPLDS